MQTCFFLPKFDVITVLFGSIFVKQDQTLSFSVVSPSRLLLEIGKNVLLNLTVFVH